MGQYNFNKPFEFHNFSEISYYGMTRLRNVNLSVFIPWKYTKTLRNIQNIKISIKYFTVAWPDSGHEFGCFIQCQHTRTILRNENIGQSLFKKYTKFWKFDEILYCWITRFWNIKLGVFRQYQNVKTIFKKLDRIVLRNFQTSKNFN